MSHNTLDAGSGHPDTPSETAGHRPAKHRRSRQCLGLLLFTATLYGAPAAHAVTAAAPVSAAASSAQTPKKTEGSRMWMTVGERRFAITLADTEAARALAAMLPLTLDMEDLNGNEKKKELPSALPTDTYKPGAIREGDLLLWGSRTVVIFYLSFDSPYAYTRLGRVDDPAGLAQALGRRGVQVVFSTR